MNYRVILAEQLYSVQPESIRSRMLDSGTFFKAFNVHPQRVVTLGGVGRIDHHTLCEAVREVLSGRGEVQVKGIDQRLFKVRVEGERVILSLSRDDEPLEVGIEGMMFLSPDADVRTRAISELIQSLGPMAADFQWLLDASVERELTGSDVTGLFHEIAHGVAGLHRVTMNAIESSTATLKELVPDSLAYYEKFCGPDPGDDTREAYTESTLPEWRRTILGRGLAAGMCTCLIGALHDDLSPGAWVNTIPDNELWSCLVACDPMLDPFSLLGALDIAIPRQHDQRFRNFAEDAVNVLTRDRFPREDDIDVYDLLPLVAELVLNRINGLEGGVPRPPYWKNMCAWMQAALLVRFTSDFRISFEPFSQWAITAESVSGAYAKILDFRREPMYAATEFSPRALRGETVGRLLQLKARHEASGHHIPNVREIELAASRLTEQGSPMGWARPGPMEGDKTPFSMGRILPEPSVTDFLEKLNKGSDGSVWSALAYSSQFFDLGEELRAKIRATIFEISLEGGEKQQIEKLNWLTETCFVAASHRDTELAGVIASRVLAGADQMAPSQAIASLRILILAAAAFEREELWSHWLEERLAMLAGRLPRGESTVEFLKHLRAVKQVLPLKYFILRRAEALAVAGQ